MILARGILDCSLDVWGLQDRGLRTVYSLHRRAMTGIDMHRHTTAVEVSSAVSGAVAP